MDAELSRVVARSAVLIAGAMGLCRAVWELTADTLHDVGHRLGAYGPGAFAGLSFEELIAVVCSSALLGCAAWVLAVTCLVGMETVVQAAARRSAPVTWMRERVCPGAVRRMLLVGCGTALVSGLGVTTVHADATGLSDPAVSVVDPGTTGVRLSGLRLPDRAVGGPGAPSAWTVGGSLTSRSRHAPSLVEVSAGDSLWSLAQQRLRGLPTDEETTAAWHAIYHANVDRVGKDPDLIFPGTTLHIPDLDPSRRKDPS